MSNPSVISILDELELMTEEIMNRLSIVTEEEFEAMAEHRELLVKRLEQMKGSITDQDRSRIKNILTFDQAILHRMHILKDQAGNWIQNQNQVKVQKNAYQHAYAANSLFFDHRN
ncbi:hypothetical protein CDO73_21925 [Saccharibacillus sp. O23]|uniref:hypothetical protein n=1 Tax=Saccharibacillus sp. O23 TaxID=2009338 RepID=UPI000B4DF90F|nr:hypothetical protein [Saccharibacillus sp. O23]OWR27596.1 hypothetical protein CDO73_21925 [Saccharibacillus sp. O23]